MLLLSRERFSRRRNFFSFVGEGGLFYFAFSCWIHTLFPRRRRLDARRCSRKRRNGEEKTLVNYAFCRQKWDYDKDFLLLLLLVVAPKKLLATSACRTLFLHMLLWCCCFLILQKCERERRELKGFAKAQESSWERKKSSGEGKAQFSSSLTKKKVKKRRRAEIASFLGCKNMA